MCVARTAARRRRQAKQNYNHLAKGNGSPRPIYHHREVGSLHESIARERAKAAREARAKAKKKSG